MNYSRNIKYFNQQLGTAPIIVSAACFAIGFIMVVFLANTRGLPGYIMTPVGLFLIAVGALIFVIRSAKKIPDSEIDEITQKLYESFKFDVNDKFLTVNIRSIRQEMDRHSVSPKPEAVVFGTYCFEGADIISKKGNDGKSRSSVYSMSAFVLKTECICLAEREISLISNKDPIPGDFKQFNYISLGEASLQKVPEKVGYEGFAKYRHLRIVDNDGATVMEFPILGDAAADSYVNDINLRIARAKERAGGRP